MFWVDQGWAGCPGFIRGRLGHLGLSGVGWVSRVYQGWAGCPGFIRGRLGLPGLTGLGWVTWV